MLGEVSWFCLHALLWSAGRCSVIISAPVTIVQTSAAFFRRVAKTPLRISFCTASVILNTCTPFVERMVTYQVRCTIRSDCCCVRTVLGRMPFRFVLVFLSDRRRSRPPSRNQAMKQSSKRNPSSPGLSLYSSTTGTVCNCQTRLRLHFRMCVFFALNRILHPSTSSTPSLRDDAPSQRRTSSVVTTSMINMW